MASRLVQLAQAITDELNSAPGGTFNLAFTAERKYQVLHELKELGSTLHVSVSPLTEETTAADRGDAEQDASIGIAIQQRVKPEEIDAMDALVELVERVKDYFTGRDIESPIVARWTGSRFAGEPFRRDHLYQDRTFTCVIVLNFETDSALAV